MPSHGYYVLAKKCVKTTARKLAAGAGVLHDRKEKQKGFGGVTDRAYKVSDRNKNRERLTIWDWNLCRSLRSGQWSTTMR